MRVVFRFLKNRYDLLFSQKPPFHPKNENPQPLKFFLFEKQYESDEKIFLREQGRLRRALDSVPKNIEQIIVMTHYPPISSDGSLGSVAHMLEADKRISHCIFGHMHKVRVPLEGFGYIRGIQYSLVAADYLDFVPQRIL